MKRTVLTTAAIAVTFAGFAFIPAKKNNAIDNVILSEVAGEETRCEEDYKTRAAFSECRKTHTTVPIEADSQSDVLEKY